MTMQNNRRAAGIAPPPEVVAAVRSLVAAETEREAARKLGVSLTALMRLYGALPVRAGTIALVRARLGALS